MKKIDEKVNEYKRLNKVSKKGCVVCFGTDYFNSMNIEELTQDSSLGVSVYNRSFCNLNIEKAIEESVMSCIYELQPRKIFLNFGENDILNSNFDIELFISKYEWLLLNLHRNCKNCKIYIISVLSDDTNIGELNKRIEKLSNEVGCSFIDIGISPKEEYSFLHVFNVLKTYIRNFHISFAEAMGFQAV